jgi:alkylhydroperoxidase/carboxymuconolactone decarboxylase family protein YurZ
MLGPDYRCGLAQYAHGQGVCDTLLLDQRVSSCAQRRHSMAQSPLPAWLQTLQQRDAEFTNTYLAQRERVLKDGAIPAKYKILMTMIVDAIQAHADGVANIANRARAAGATEAEINEAVEVAYLFGGTPALVTAVNAFRSA